MDLLDKSPKAANILEEANMLVSEERELEYGRADYDFTCSAALLNAMGFRFQNKYGIYELLDASHIPLLMILMKMARLKNKTGYWHKDSWVDIAGYARTAEIVHDNMPHLANPKVCTVSDGT